MLTSEDSTMDSMPADPSPEQAAAAINRFFLDPTKPTDTATPMKDMKTHAAVSTMAEFLRRLLTDVAWLEKHEENLEPIWDLFAQHQCLGEALFNSFRIHRAAGMATQDRDDIVVASCCCCCGGGGGCPNW